jgi:hypothetical protein
MLAAIARIPAVTRFSDAMSIDSPFSPNNLSRSQTIDFRTKKRVETIILNLDTPRPKGAGILGSFSQLT